MISDTEREKAAEFVAAWRDDDAEMRIPSGEWGDNLAHHIDVLLSARAADAEEIQALRMSQAIERRTIAALRAHRDELITEKASLAQQIAAAEFCDQCAGPYEQDWLQEQYGGHWDTCPNRHAAPSPVTPESETNR